MKNPKSNRRRYYLHSVLKKQGYNIDGRNRTVFIDNPSVELTKHASELLHKFKYNFQTQIT